MLLLLFLIHSVISQCNCPVGGIKCHDKFGFITCESQGWVYRKCGTNLNCLQAGTVVVCGAIVPTPTATCTMTSTSATLTSTIPTNTEATTSTSSTPTTTSEALFQWPSNKKLIVYHPNWVTYGKNYQVKDLPIDSISDINYAFFNLIQANGSYIPQTGDSWGDFEKTFTADQAVGGVAVNWDSDNKGNFGQFIRLKQSGKQFNFGLSIGGWTWSTSFSPAFETEQSRQAFVDACINLINTYKQLIQRIDIDWEYISTPANPQGNAGNVVGANDPSNYLQFIKLLKSQLSSQGLDYIEISMCLPASTDIGKVAPLLDLVPFIDTFNIMTYDFASSPFGTTIAGHQSNLCSTNYASMSIDYAVQGYLKLGLPANKIVIGAVTYSRVFANTDGLGQSTSGTYTDTGCTDAVCDYKLLPISGATEQWDSKAKASYSYDPVKKVLQSYDTPQSAIEKAKYVWKYNLKGIIVWESSGDAVGDRSVIQTLAQNMKTKPDLSNAGCP